MTFTAGALLGGRVPYVQPAEGYRTGIEPILLAASIPALPGQRVGEAGLGAGAGLLCLLARVPSLHATGVERDEAMAALAAQNLGGHATVVAADFLAFQAASLWDHAYANPPWHDPAGTPSPIEGRRAAKQAGAGTLGAWTARLAACVRPRGTVTLLLPAGQVGAALESLGSAGCGGRTVFPLWPKAGRNAKLALLRATRNSRAPDCLAPGLVLHEADGSYTAAARAVLWDGAALAF